MDPITLRIQTDLLSELESEAEEYGYSSRAEYIRHILQDRLDTNPAMASERGTTSANVDRIRANSEDIDSIQSELSDIHMQISALESKVEALSQKLERSQVKEDANVTNMSADNQEVTSSDTIEDLETWLDNHGPQKEKAQLIIGEAARILKKQGPMEAGKIKQLLHDEFPEAYSSEKALWESTVDQVYKEAPGFSKPEYGIYNFD